MRECFNEDRGIRGMFFGHRGAGRGPFGHRGFGRGHSGHQGGVGDAMMGRILGHGDLRFVILALLKEKPSHGYELIKQLEEKSAGQYTPSPGVIYPTLTFLEEGGFATASIDENKKLYTITEEGRTLLLESEDQVAAIFERMRSVGDKMSRLREWFGKDDEKARDHHDSRHAIRSVMHMLKRELFAKMPISKDRQKQIAVIIERAAAEIRALK